MIGCGRQLQTETQKTKHNYLLDTPDLLCTVLALLHLLP